MNYKNTLHIGICSENQIRISNYSYGGVFKIEFTVTVNQYTLELGNICLSNTVLYQQYIIYLAFRIVSI